MYRFHPCRPCIKVPWDALFSFVWLKKNAGTLVCTSSTSLHLFSRFKKRSFFLKKNDGALYERYGNDQHWTLLKTNTVLKKDSVIIAWCMLFVKKKRFIFAEKIRHISVPLLPLTN
jgi:uncharacterized protein YqjF (DUF2071 family)